jgi:hypothetical protein
VVNEAVTRSRPRCQDFYAYLTIDRHRSGAAACGCSRVTPVLSNLVSNVPGENVDCCRRPSGSKLAPLLATPELSRPIAARRAASPHYHRRRAGPKAGGFATFSTGVSPRAIRQSRGRYGDLGHGQGGGYGFACNGRPARRGRGKRGRSTSALPRNAGRASYPVTQPPGRRHARPAWCLHAASIKRPYVVRL